MPASSLYQYREMLKVLTLLDKTKRNRIKYKLKRSKWLRFRKQFFKKKIKENQPLVCHYCKRTDLIAFTDDLSMIATVDHVIPVCNENVDPFDTTNLVVSCHKCNNQKSNKIVDIYK